MEYLVVGAGICVGVLVIYIVTRSSTITDFPVSPSCRTSDAKRIVELELQVRSLKTALDNKEQVLVLSCTQLRKATDKITLLQQEIDNIYQNQNKYKEI